MDQRPKRLIPKRFLGEQEISDFFSDELSDVPYESASDSDSQSDSECGRGEQKIVTTDSELESDRSSDECEGSNIVGTATWGKVDKTPALGQFTGNPGVKQIPSDPTQVSEVAELFFGDSFFDMLCQETNRYYLQHREHYDRSYKALKWVDVTSAEMRWKFRIYSGDGKKLQETILSVLESYLDQNYHVYQDNYYNSVATAEHIFSRKVRVCGTIRVNRGLPPDLKEECKPLKHGETTFRRKGDILLQSWKDTHVVNMISTIHNLSMVDVQRRHGQVKKPVCISEYNMFMKGVDRADQYLDYYSLPRKTVKWTKKVALWLINCTIFNSFLVFKNLNPHSKLKYKAFLLNVAKAWATDHTVAAELAADTVLVRPGKSTPTPRRPHFDPPGRLLGDMRKHTLTKTVKSEHSTGSSLLGNAVFAQFTRKGVGLPTFSSFV
ncbi:hypothetical protein B7P43_G09860 [Cryptotermes secundus]|uniref:PiggyBac transposable element-derived protein domain-containing protein n=1 Tax=Cryptotermes secundus TaxID=105785 RepID=A0A2J7PC61_9NEOP|nr:hypothetical protein B7P43_G09860 [Cryptotermes secundus]